MTFPETMAAKANGVVSLLARLRAELKANRRAALGILVVCGLVGGYGLLALADAVDAESARLVETDHRLGRLIDLGAEKDWLQRASVGEQMRKALESRLWQADNDGIARADLQDWVTNQGRAAGLDKLRVSVDSVRPTGLPGNYRAITATLSAQWNEASLISFIDRIQRDPHLLVVDHFQARDKPVGSLEMKLIAYVVIASDRSSAK